MSIEWNITCPVCGKRFRATKRTQMYCNLVCKNNAYRYRRNGVKLKYDRNVEMIEKSYGQNEKILQAKVDYANHLGISYGELVAKETLRKCGKVDVTGIMRELKKG